MTQTMAQLRAEAVRLRAETAELRAEQEQLRAGGGAVPSGLVSEAAASAAAARRGDPAFAANPILEQFRVEDPELVRSALQNGPAPTLFESGDLPPITASGVDPQVLLQLPWLVRHAAAQAESRGAVLAMVEEFVGSPDLAGLDGAVAGHEGNHEYTRRMRQWLVAGMTDGGYDAVFAESDASRPPQPDRRTAAQKLSDENVRRAGELARQQYAVDEQRLRQGRS